MAVFLFMDPLFYPGDPLRKGWVVFLGIIFLQIKDGWCHLFRVVVLQLFHELAIGSGSVVDGSHLGQVFPSGLGLSRQSF